MRLKIIKFILIIIITNFIFSHKLYSFNGIILSSTFLDYLRSKLETEFSKKYPEISCSVFSYTLTCEYLPQKFMIHTTSETGEISKDLHEQLGPSSKGFILNVSISETFLLNLMKNFQEAKYPSEHQSAYWTTYFNQFPLKSKQKMDLPIEQDEVLRMWLSYGSKTDRELIEKIENLITKEVSSYGGSSNE